MEKLEKKERISHQHAQVPIRMKKLRFFMIDGLVRYSFRPMASAGLRSPSSLEKLTPPAAAASSAVSFRGRGAAAAASAPFASLVAAAAAVAPTSSASLTAVATSPATSCFCFYCVFRFRFEKEVRKENRRPPQKKVRQAETVSFSLFFLLLPASTAAAPAACSAGTQSAAREPRLNPARSSRRNQDS